MAMFKKEEVVEDFVLAGEETAEVSKNDEVTFITKNTTITGDVATEGNLVLDGVVNGNINVDGNLVLRGSTTGGVNAGSLLIQTGEVKSNIAVRDSIIVNEETTVYGDVDCQDITVHGSVVGNITATGTVFLKNTAAVKGNINANAVGMEIGAKVCGKIDCK